VNRPDEETMIDPQALITPPSSAAMKMPSRPGMIRGRNVRARSP
jgi:hypothetical protein